MSISTRRYDGLERPCKHHSACTRAHFAEQYRARHRCATFFTAREAFCGNTSEGDGLASRIYREINSPEGLSDDAHTAQGRQGDARGAQTRHTCSVHWDNNPGLLPLIAFIARI